MKNSISSLIILCSLSVFSQNNKQIVAFEPVVLDGKTAYINVMTGEIVTDKPTKTLFAQSKVTKGISKVDTDAMSHLVTKGETLYSISKMYGISVDELRALNADISLDVLSIHQNIKVYKGIVEAANTVTNTASIVINDTVSSNGYIVKKGDTLYSISKMFNLSVSDLKSKNSLTSNVISIGQTLTIK